MPLSKSGKGAPVSFTGLKKSKVDAYREQYSGNKFAGSSVTPKADKPKLIKNQVRPLSGAKVSTYSKEPSKTAEKPEGSISQKVMPVSTLKRKVKLNSNTRSFNSINAPLKATVPISQSLAQKLQSNDSYTNKYITQAKRSVVPKSSALSESSLRQSGVS